MDKVFCVSYIYSSCIDRNSAFISSPGGDFCTWKTFPEVSESPGLHKVSIELNREMMWGKFKTKYCSIISHILDVAVFQVLFGGSSQTSQLCTIDFLNCSLYLWTNGWFFPNTTFPLLFLFFSPLNLLPCSFIVFETYKCGAASQTHKFKHIEEKGFFVKLYRSI